MVLLNIMNVIDFSAVLQVTKTILQSAHLNIVLEFDPIQFQVIVFESYSRKSTCVFISVCPSVKDTLAS